MFIKVSLYKPGNLHNPKWVDISTHENYAYKSSFGEVFLKRRTSYPSTYARALDDLLVIGYGWQGAVKYINSEFSGLEDDFYTKEFLVITIDLNTFELKMIRDAFCTLPIFAKVDDEQLVLCDSLDVLLKTTNYKPDADWLAVRELIYLENIGDITLFKSVHLTESRTRLKWKNGKYSVTKGIKLQKIPQLDPVDFKNLLDDTLDYYWSVYGGDKTAFECSGGLDSSTMPQYIRNKHVKNIKLATMVFPYNFGHTQLDKLASFKDDIVCVEIDHKKHYPLSRFFVQNTNFTPFYQYQEIYTEPLNELAQLLNKQGYKTVFTGIGGDELFENITTNQKEKKSPETPIYFTNIFKDIINHTDKKAEQINFTLLANSAYYSLQSRNLIYINNDIWPVAPLANPKLYEYCQTLPIEYKSNKNILRAYHQSYKFDNRIYQPVQNEHFGRFFDDAMRFSGDLIIENIKNKSYLAENGYIDYDLLIDEFRRIQSKENASSEIFMLFRIFTLDINYSAVFL